MQPSSGSEPAPPDARDSLGDLLRNRPYVAYIASRAAAGMGLTAQTAVLSWQVYDLTDSALPLAFLGLFRFAPSIAISFVAGALADTRDRRLIIAISQMAYLAVSALLAFLTAAGTINLTVIYASVAVLGLAMAFEAPARASLLPQVVTRAQFQRGIAVATTVAQLSMMVGPATVGLIIDQQGVPPAYLFHVAIVLVGVAGLPFVRIAQGSNPTGIFSWALIKEGIVFVKTHPPVLGAMALDMFAVVFAGAEALLPIYARDILQVGPAGYGQLLASKGIGAFTMSVAIALLPPMVHTGRILVIVVVLYGIGTIAFGLSTWFPLSLVIYALMAAVDQVSVVIRQTIIQMETPDALRGRVSSVNSLFIGASNQLGAVESGVVASLTGSAVFAVVSGGVGCLISAAAVTKALPQLWGHRTLLHAEAPADPNPAVSARSQQPRT